MWKILVKTFLENPLHFEIFRFEHSGRFFVPPLLPPKKLFCSPTAMIVWCEKVSIFMLLLFPKHRRF